MKTRPNWYTKEHDGTWERVKAAFKNDWEQTKNDFGVKGNRDLDQDVHYGKDYPEWNDELSSKLATDYDRDWKRDEPLVRYAYRYNFSRM